MSNSKFSILSTRLLPDELISELQSENLVVDQLSFIETEILQSIEALQEIEYAYLQTTAVAFTSINAVEAVASEQKEQQPEWIVYCTGPATRKQVEKYFGEEIIAGTADSASELAELIIEDEVDELIFFCGDKRRDELPSILREHDIHVNEIVVYQTIAVSHKIEKNYHGILFFSPSAVESFFKKNKLSENTILFAIGKTTADSIKSFSSNTIITADNPSKEDLVQEVIGFFK